MNEIWIAAWTLKWVFLFILVAVFGCWLFSIGTKKMESARIAKEWWDETPS